EKTTLAQDEYRKLELQLGTTELRGVVSNFKQVYHLESKKRSLMGISVPMFHLIDPESENTNNASYSLKRTSAKFDENLFLFKDCLQAIIQLSEVQSTISRLAKEIIETKRRVNALNYIIIPRIKATVKWIRLTLAERERESFVRLKKVKKKISG
ncbi:MAG: V-type ATP synthase subunit D, partial [Candidatus Heimdallarchaeota archaeon]|nr:V-type ATP synthase subunit D [Candidatus Heimdallarchaeota archaeon]